MSTDWPFLIAHTEAPLPRWQLMMFSSFAGLPRRSAASRAMNR
ncbi:Uncharacterised protein [Vibrio cholerae]|nr:Uncharacterised protein [Vibrio cholerae]